MADMIERMGEGKIERDELGRGDGMGWVRLG